jgi:hypothetical protein
LLPGLVVAVASHATSGGRTKTAIESREQGPRRACVGPSSAVAFHNALFLTDDVAVRSDRSNPPLLSRGTGFSPPSGRCKSADHRPAAPTPDTANLVASYSSTSRLR